MTAAPSVTSAGRVCATPTARILLQPDAYVLDGFELDAGRFVVGTSAGLLACLDASTLQSLWSSSVASPSLTGSLARIDANTFATATNDGVHIFDVRTAGATRSLRGKRPYQSVAAAHDGGLLACGTELLSSEAVVEIWDARTAGKVPTHAFAEVASDDVPSLQFAPDGRLLVGSTDGLMSILDPTQPDADEALLHVANVGASIKAARWTQDGAGLIAQTDMETVELWRLAADGVRRRAVNSTDVTAGTRAVVRRCARSPDRAAVDDRLRDLGRRQREGRRSLPGLVEVRRCDVRLRLPCAVDHWHSCASTTPSAGRWRRRCPVGIRRSFGSRSSTRPTPCASTILARFTDVDSTSSRAQRTALLRWRPSILMWRWHQFRPPTVRHGPRSPVAGSARIEQPFGAPSTPRDFRTSRARRLALLETTPPLSHPLHRDDRRAAMAASTSSPGDAGCVSTARSRG